MKSSQFIVSLSLLVASTVSLASPNTVPNTMAKAQVDLQNALGADCRPGEKYWESNKGISVDFRAQTLTPYKDNGYTKGDEEFFECKAQGNSVQCTGDNYALHIPNVQNQSIQSSADVSDALGSMFGGGNKRATVTPGVLVKKGFFSDSQKVVSCIVR